MAASAGRASERADLGLHHPLPTLRLQRQPVDDAERHQRGAAQLPHTGAHHVEGLRAADRCLQQQRSGRVQRRHQDQNQGGR